MIRTYPIVPFDQPEISVVPWTGSICQNKWSPCEIKLITMLLTHQFCITAGYQVCSNRRFTFVATKVLKRDSGIEESLGWRFSAPHLGCICFVGCNTWIWISVIYLPISECVEQTILAHINVILSEESRSPIHLELSSVSSSSPSLIFFWSCPNWYYQWS